MIMRSRVTAPRAERAVLSSSESLNERVDPSIDDLSSVDSTGLNYQDCEVLRVLGQLDMEVGNSCVRVV